MDTNSSTPPPLFSIALLSAAVLGCEILLMRLLSIIQWHHFAYMIISIALLGYGASGALVSLAQNKLKQRFAYVFVACAVLFGICSAGSFFLAQQVPFNPLEFLWDPHQPYRLLLIYLLLFLPFFFAANCICLTFSVFPDHIHRIYSFDILGAGAGSLGIIVALFVFSPLGALKLLGSMGIAAAALACVECKLRPRALPALLALGAMLMPLAWHGDFSELRLSPYKELSQALQVKDARIIEQTSSPLALITVVESPLIPFRHAPGLSLNASGEPPPQLGIFSDGDSMSALNRFDQQYQALGYLDYLTSALPYHLIDNPRVLVLGAGAGMDVLQGLYHHAKQIDAVELNSQVVDLVQHRFAGFSGKPYSAPGVRVFVAEARGFVAASREQYDLIQVALVDAFGASSAGLYALSESYLYTVEAFQDYVRHLRPGGMLALTRWVALPPRDALKLFATAVSALEQDGVSQPGKRLVLIRGWKTSTLLVKNGEFSEPEIAAIKTFCRERSFDLEYYPGIKESETNRYNILEQSYYFEGAQALLGTQRQDFLERYKFDVTPASDDKPYFFHFFKWRVLPEFLSLKDRGGLPLLEWGYPLLVATLAQALLASLVLIIVPLWAMELRREKAAAPVISRVRVGWYFLAIGFAFMFIEIAFIQKFILFLSHPIYAVAVVLCAFLIFAGLGSRFSQRLAQKNHALPFSQVAWVVFAICLVALLYLAALPALFKQFIGLPDALKIAISIGLIAPLAFPMGMPFPLGLGSVASRSAPLVPWARGINACASVLGAILATLLAIHLGFTVVIVAALGFYVLAAASFPLSDTVKSPSELKRISNHG
ncbi:MAG TPA: SAM-dependent methyltransferase [Burkholderiales bacterium]|nr:SAM-dependent methyltransferase [Burkholderiales bacterium]